jgi:hypothetical protein
MVVVVICGGGTKLTVNVADLVGSVTEVALNVAVLAAPTLAGALYVVVVVVEPVSDPRPVTADHVTPALLGSFVTVAVTNCVLPWSSVTGPVGENPTVIAGLIVTLSPVVVAVLPTESVNLTAKG